MCQTQLRLRLFLDLLLVTECSTAGRKLLQRRDVLLDDPRVVIGFTLLTLGYDLNTKDPAQLQEAKQKLQELILRSRFDANKEYEIQSTPSFVINGEMHAGALPIEAFAKLIEPHLN